MQRRGKVAIGIAAAVVVAGFIAWQIAGAAGAHDVVVTTDARPLVCAPGQELVQNSDGRYVELARLTPKLDCTLRIHVYNDSIFPVSVTNARFATLGPGSTVATIDDIADNPIPTRGGRIDASGPVLTLDVLQAGQGATVTAHVRAARTTCMGAGGSASEFETTFSLNILGLPEDRGATNVDFGFLGTSQSTSKAC
jgi:hypothetical protein